MDVATAAFNTINAWRSNADFMPDPVRNNTGLGLRHVHWMLLEIIRQKDEWKNDKLNRWLGWAQATVVFSGYLTLEECKKANLDA